MWNNYFLIKTLNEEFETMIFTSSSFFIQSKFQFVANFEFQTKFKFEKFEKFTINFNSTSTISDFESIIKLNIVLVANSIFILISKSSNSTFLRLISFCSTSTILLFNQSKFQLVANFKFKFNRFFKSFKFEKFAINFNSNSISIKSKFENVFIQSNVFLVANSNSIQVSKNSKLNSFQSILFYSTATKLRSNRATLVAEEKMKQKIVVAEKIAEKTIEQIVIEIIKSEIINFMNINFFNFIM